MLASGPVSTASPGRWQVSASQGSAEPLTQTLARLPGHRWPQVVPGPATGGGWCAAADLHGTATLDQVIDSVHAEVVASVPGAATVPPTVAPSYVLDWYLRAVAAAAAGPFVHARRVPRLAADVVAVRMADGGWPEAVALLSPEFTCLPDDPDAGHPAAGPVDDLESLRAVLRAEFAGHVQGFLAAWGARGRRGRWSLWAAATDALAEALQATAPGGRGAREAAAVLPDDALRRAPFVAPARFRGVGRPGAPGEPLRQRVSCCFAYAVPGGDACFTCPRTSDVERARRLAAEGRTG